MKSRLALVLLGAVLVAAVPVWADGMSHFGLTKNSTVILHMGKIDSSKVSNVRDSKSFAAPDKFSGRPDVNVHPANLTGLNAGERASVMPHATNTWLTMGEGLHAVTPTGGDDPVPAQVPEPGSFSLLLLGLACVGLIAHGRAAGTKTN